jgi:hypothetical protein
MRSAALSHLVALLALANAVKPRLKALPTLRDAPPSLPCDILAAAGSPCVAALSTVRALFAAYAGPLYRVTRATDNATLDVRPIAAGGFADAAAQDAFCGAANCSVTVLFDQSARANHLTPAPPGGHVHTPDLPVDAARLPVALRGGARAFGLFFTNGTGYRNDNTSGVATGNDPETIYMVTSGTHVNRACCFDFGNAESDAKDHGPGTMEALYFGLAQDAHWSRGTGAGPWVMVDLENGVYGGNTTINPNNTPLTMPFVTAMVKGRTDGFVLKGGDATTGALKVMYDGPRPTAAYQPMRKMGALILGIGGDNSDKAVGDFFEGAVTAGLSTDAADDAVQASIIAAGYALVGGSG